jgi:hypothetical protein
MWALTNIPYHSAAPDENDPPKHIHAMTTEHPASNKEEALRALSDAVPLYGDIPNEFHGSEPYHYYYPIRRGPSFSHSVGLRPLKRSLIRRNRYLYGSF